MRWKIRSGKPDQRGAPESQLYGDLWPMVRYLRANEWSVFIVPVNERQGDMMYRVGTKLMSAEGLASTYYRVHERNERAKAMAASRQSGTAPSGGGGYLYLPERPDNGGSGAGDRPLPERPSHRTTIRTRKGRKR